MGLFKLKIFFLGLGSSLPKIPGQPAKIDGLILFLNRILRRDGNSLH